MSRRGRALYSVSLGLGNALLTVPALKALAALTGQPVDILDCGLGFPGIGDLLALQPFVGQVRARVPSEMGLYRYFVGSYWAEAPRRIPAGARRASAPKDWRRWHEVECNLQAVQELGYRGVTPTARITVPAKPPAGLPAEFVVVGMGSGGLEFKKYPHWKAVCRQLSAAGLALVFLGTGKDRPDWTSRYGLDLFDRTTLLEAASIMSQARLYVGIDNGLSHLSAATATPSVVIYGPTAEQKNRPWTQDCKIIRSGAFSCEPCWGNPPERTCWHTKKERLPCLLAVRPEYVAAEIMLAAANPPRIVAPATDPLAEILRGHPIGRVSVSGADGLRWVKKLESQFGFRLKLVESDADLALSAGKRLPKGVVRPGGFVLLEARNASPKWLISQAETVWEVASEGRRWTLARLRGAMGYELT